LDVAENEWQTRRATDCGGRISNQIEAVGPVEEPGYKEMRETLDIRKPAFEFRQDSDCAFCFVFGSKPLRDRGSIFSMGYSQIQSAVA
jgi:hypothetical protein